MRHSTFTGEVDIDYVLRKSTTRSDILVISFPGAGGDRFRADALGLGYMMTIGQFNVNALYIKNSSKDFARSWFVGFEGDFAIERTMIELVRFACQETGATRCVGIGSSLGGNTVLYYGLKYNWDIISGGARAKKGYIGQLIRDMVPTAKQNGFDKHVYMCWGRGEPMWINQTEAPSLVELFDKSGVPYKMDLLNYSVHANISKMFPAIIKKELGTLLGVAAPAAGGAAEPTAAEVTAEVNTLIEGLKPYIGELEQTTPNYAIRHCLNHGDHIKANMLRTFVYASHHYHWLPGANAPVRYEPEQFWKALPSQSAEYTNTMWYPATLMNYYKTTGEVSALHLAAENIAQFLELRDSEKPASADYKKWWTTQQRAQCLIDFACAVRNEPPVAPETYTDHLRLDVRFRIDWDKLKHEVILAVNRSIEAEVLITSFRLSYARLYFLLLVAEFFGRNPTFRDEAFKRVMQATVMVTDYYFDGNGFCIFEQTQGHHSALRAIKRIVDFTEMNGFTPNSDSKKLKRKLASIELAASHLTREDGFTPNLGHSDFVKSATGAATGNLIKTSSNISTLSGDNAYITIGGGSNVHSSFRHCDLLSFTFRYDGKQLVWDAGGGKSELADYARSAVAHSALFCDEADYITPDFADWTALEDSVETEDYVLVTGRHMLIDGVTLSRKWLWLKPNIMIIYDEAESKDDHLYTQNFLLPNMKFKSNGSHDFRFSIADGYTFRVTQLPTESDFHLRAFGGTTNTAAADDTLRGSRIVGFRKVEKLSNLAFEKRTKNATFLTVLQAHSGRETELTFESADISGGRLNATASRGGKILRVSEKLSNELF